MNAKMKYPTQEKIYLADRIQICKWHRFLPSPSSERQAELLSIIEYRYKELGGMTSEISKLIGF